MVRWPAGTSGFKGVRMKLQVCVCLPDLQVEMVNAEACCLETPSEPPGEPAPRRLPRQVPPNSLPQGSPEPVGWGRGWESRADVLEGTSGIVPGRLQGSEGRGVGRGLPAEDAAYLRCVSEGGVGQWQVRSQLGRGRSLWRVWASSW